MNAHGCTPWAPAASCHPSQGYCAQGEKVLDFQFQFQLYLISKLADGSRGLPTSDSVQRRSSTGICVRALASSATVSWWDAAMKSWWDANSVFKAEQRPAVKTSFIHSVTS